MIQLAGHADALALLAELGASPSLVRHNELVVEAAIALTGGLRGVRMDRGAVLIGAALHGVGRQRLLDHGVPAELARFGDTHEGGALEDLLVALAARLWNGVRDEALEGAVVARVAELAGVESWSAFERVDALCEEIAAGADERLARSSR